MPMVATAMAGIRMAVTPRDRWQSKERRASAESLSVSTISVVRIATAAVVATAYNCPPSNDRSTSIHGDSPADFDAAFMN
jgi:hypothetical protein